MKIAHHNPGPAGREEWLANAKENEAKGDLEQAATAYQKIIKQDPLHEYSYNRLQIIYRKLKDYKKELAIINAGIKAFEIFFNKRRLPAGNNKISNLSKSLMRSVGLTDKKGNVLYEPDPIARWRKRKTTVEKRLKK
jgi:tetratricopeptide (TPR) repeat protein